MKAFNRKSKPKHSTKMKWKWFIDEDENDNKFKYHFSISRSTKKLGVIQVWGGLYNEEKAWNRYAMFNCNDLVRWKR